MLLLLTGKAIGKCVSVRDQVDGVFQYLIQRGIDLLPAGAVVKFGVRYK